MKIENNYPKIKTNVNKFLMIRKVILIIFLITVVVCTIVNLSIGGKKWMFYVVLGEIIFYFAILNKPLIDNTFVKRITIVLLIICCYLYMIDLIEKTSWSYFVIDIILFAIIIIQLLLFLIEFNNKNREFVPIFFTSLGGLVFTILALVKVLKMNWAVIVLGSLGLASLIVLLLFYRKTILYEMKKYWSMK